MSYEQTEHDYIVTLEVSDRGKEVTPEDVRNILLESSMRLADAGIDLLNVYVLKVEE